MKMLFAGCALAAILLPTVGAAETSYRTFEAAPADVHLFWLDPSGRPFGPMRRLLDFLSRQPGRVRMLMNGGIFESGGIPSGLCVIEGRQLLPINRRDGRGNFYLKPNGVFFVEGSTARVLSTGEYVAAAPSPRIAIQSGPLLLQHGQVHPAFSPASTSRLHRNGVGILPDGRILFAITEFGQERYPTLYEFAEFFRSRGCREALFLDGDISQMEIDPDGRLKVGNHFGTMIAVIEGRRR